MIYKRATAQLRKAGIEHIVIVKRLWGPTPHDPRMRAQTSQCFNTTKEAVQAVIAGYRPKRWKPIAGRKAPLRFDALPRRKRKP